MVPGKAASEKILREQVSPEDFEVTVEIVDSLVLSPTGKQIRIITDFSPWDK